jgi:putative ABC transport system permease protein
MSVNWLTWILKNLNRNRRRTLLTLSSLTASLFLLGALAAAYRFINSPSDSDGTHLVLVVSPRASMTMMMPLWYKDRIAALPGVTAVSPFGYLPGHYGKDDALIPAVALEPAAVFELLSDWKVPAAEKQAFMGEKTAVVAGRKLAEKYGWKLGDHIHLTSSMYNILSLDLTLRGIYTSPNDEGAVAIHWDYLNEAMGRLNEASLFWVRASSAEVVPHLTQAIDAIFRDAPVETRTGTLKQYLLDFLSLLGNVKLMVLWVCGAVVFAVLLVVSNTMGMAIRERTVEIATLRALGYRPRHILALLAGESLLLCAAGGALGLAGSWALARVASGLAVGGLMPAHLTLGGATPAVMASAALSIGLVSTLVPAWRASHSNIAQALRFVG